MFYNPEDVKWFKPAELSTKLGAAGHIREPVGTHGLMKVRFNRIIQQSDTVCLPLFKRVFPKLLPAEIEEDGAHAAHFP
jgi:pre-rRNA-processing protein TSR1